MRKTVLTSLVGGALLTLASAAFASQPMQLSDAQMDTISAGTQSSTASGTASSLLGFASVSVSTSATSAGPVRTTQASALSVAFGPGSDATANAHSTH